MCATSTVLLEAYTLRSQWLTVRRQSVRQECITPQMLRRQPCGPHSTERTCPRATTDAGGDGEGRGGPILRGGAPRGDAADARRPGAPLPGAARRAGGPGRQDGAGPAGHPGGVQFATPCMEMRRLLSGSLPSAQHLLLSTWLASAIRWPCGIISTVIVGAMCRVVHRMEWNS